MVARTTVEQRLAALEQEVADLKLRVDRNGSEWLDRSSGAMADIPDADFEEFVQFGREFRTAQQDVDGE